MNKYIAIIITIALIIATALVLSVSQIQKENTKTFSAEGYILQNKSNGQVQDIERYYFNANENYKKQYNDKVMFTDTSGDSITVSMDNFLHYTNGSISSLTKGVILNLDTLDMDPILYYTISEKQTLNKSGDSYTIKNLGRNLTFKNFIWKISDSKYLVCGQVITIKFNNGQTKDISGYIEVEYSDNEVVRIYNQEVTYQTVSSNLYLMLKNNVKINLGNKIVSKDNENKMSLESMVINSNDNVEIIDIEDEKYKDKSQEENITEENVVEDTDTITQENTNPQNFGYNGPSSTSTTENENSSGTDQIQLDGGDASQVVGGITINEGEENTEEEDDTSNETIVEETPQIVTPTFKVEDFDIDSISMATKIAITDEESTLVDNPVVTIIRNDTGKVVYENEESSGAFAIDINVASLSPDTEYTLVVRATYKAEEIEYSKNFIHKIFRTKSAGIELEKDYFTDDTLAFKCNIEFDSKVSGADIVLSNEYNQTIETKKIEREGIKNIEFMGLNSNTHYIVTITNVIYDEQVITNGFEKSEVYTTLKERPEISGAIFELDKRNGNFLISIQNIKDEDRGITSCQYEIYDARNAQEGAEPVLIIGSNRNEQVTVPVDEVKIKREIPYIFKLVSTFDDNEKELEIESEYSDIMMLTGKQFPTLRFIEKTVTFERIEGTIKIDDEYGAINLEDDNPITLIFTDSIGNSFTDTSKGSLNVPVKAYGLRANETYKIGVYTKIDLDEFDEDDPIENCYIGGVVVKTKFPQEMQGNFAEDTEDVRNTFLVNFQLTNAPGTEGTLEAETLSGLTFNIYAGQSTDGAPYRTVRDVDLNLERYESTLKEKYYDQSIDITPEFFGSDNKDFKDKYYTITVTNAYDYTTHQNNLPIVNNTFTIGTKGYRPDLPTDPNNALDVTQIRNRDKDQREDLDPSTIVGYEVKAKFNNIDLYARRLVYKVYDATTDRLIEEQELLIGDDGIVPSAIFNVGDGTPANVEDTDMMRRGNRYYFNYEIYLDLNSDGYGETLYPYTEENLKLKSKQIIPKKQEAKIKMYPSTSNNNSITYKYKVNDIDHGIQDNEIQALVGTSIRDRKVVTIDANMDGEYNEVTFLNLSPGNISLDLYEAVDKAEYPSLRKISEFYFEGKVNLDNLRYNAVIESNRVIITLHTATEKIDRIAGIDVEFIGETKTIVKNFLYPDNNTIIINLSDIAELKNQQITVDIYAYYDNGLIGFDGEEGGYNLYEKAHLAGEQAYYCKVNKSNNWVYTPSAVENMYTTVRNGTELTITNPMKDNKTTVINLIQLEGGFSYEYDLINQKQVEKTKVTSDGNNTISFNYVIPEISLVDKEGKINIVSELQEAKFKATIINKANTTIENNLINIEIYKTDENGNNEEFVRTDTKTLNQFGDYVIIDNLQPKVYYYIKFKVNLVTDEGLKEEYLYDVDYQVVGKNYYFSTLTSVGIDNIEVSYNPTNYYQKTIDINYSLDRIFGFDKITYTIQKWDEVTASYYTVLDGIESTLFKKQMEVQIDCYPGSVFEFNKKYKVIVTPIAMIQNPDGTTRELDVGTVEKEFTLQTLITPLYGIIGRRYSNDSIIFRVTVYDTDKVIVNDEYSIKILNERDEDITPEEYVNKKYKTTSLNNRITLPNAERTQGYRIEVTANVDMNNDGINIVEMKKIYKVNPINSSGITVGNITATANYEQSNKIDLVFTDSYNLTQVTQIKYSIYDTNGYSINGTQSFVPTVTNFDEEAIYTFTLEQGLQEESRYYIELQFLKNGITVDNYSLEYTYLEQ